MTTLDLIILVVVGIGLARGYWTGVVRQVADLLGTIAAFLLALKLMYPVGTAVETSLGISARIAPAVGFVLVFVGIQLGVVALSRALEKVLSALRMSLLNRLAGTLFGGLKAVLLLSVLLLVLRVFDVPADRVRAESLFYRPVYNTLPGVWDWSAERWPRLESLAERFNFDAE